MDLCRALAEARDVLMEQLALVAEEAGQLQSDLQHKANVIAAQVHIQHNPCRLSWLPHTIPNQKSATVRCAMDFAAARCTAYAEAET